MTDQTTVSGSDAGRQDEQPQGHLALSTTQAVQGLDAAAGVRPSTEITPIDEMCAILKEHYINADEYTDCAILYRVTFDQLRALYDRGIAAAGVDGIRYTSWCDEHGRATPCDKCQQATNWPETVLMVRAWFEGNADAALAELEHRAKAGATS